MRVVKRVLWSSATKRSLFRDLFGVTWPSQCSALNRKPFEHELLNAATDVRGCLDVGRLDILPALCMSTITELTSLAGVADATSFERHWEGIR